MSENFYDLLGVAKNASESEIKSAYKKLARKYHPDNRDTGNEEMFKKIGAAYEVLSDPQKKAFYDRTGHEEFMRGGASGGAHGGFSDSDIFDQFEHIFEAFFGGGGRSGGSARQSVERGSDIQVSVELDFLESVFGCSKTVTINKHISCIACNGSGADPKHPPKTCDTCRGRGEIRRNVQSLFGTITQISTCPSCNGSGTVISHLCKVCNGKGLTPDKQEFTVEVPKGIEHGMRILYRGRGNDGRSLHNNKSIPGDLYIAVKVKPSDKWKRNGLDVQETLEISLWQAVMGDEVEIKTLRGTHKLDIKPGTQAATVITLRKQGIELENGQIGDHYVNIDIKIPKKNELPTELQDLLAKLYSGSSNNPDNSDGGILGNIFKRGK